MIGIQQTKDVLGFGAEFGESMAKSLEDGKISLGEYVNFIPALIKLPVALTGITQVKAELLDLSDEESAELNAFLQSEFDITDDKAEVFIEDTIDMVLSVFQYVQKHFLA